VSLLRTFIFYEIIDKYENFSNKVRREYLGSIKIIRALGTRIGGHRHPKNQGCGSGFSDCGCGSVLGIRIEGQENEEISVEKCIF
jgi:hypothetical protein